MASLGIDEVGVEGEDPSITARRREKESILAAVDRQEREAEGRASGKDRVRIDWEKPKERWDCETVLSKSSLHLDQLSMLMRRISQVPIVTFRIILDYFGCKKGRDLVHFEFELMQRLVSLSWN